MRKLKSVMIVIGVLLAFQLIPATSGAMSSGGLSAALRAVIGQAEQAYLVPYGGSMQFSIDNDPRSVAVVLGLAMHRQKVYMEKDYAYLTHFHTLRAEVLSFLETLAKAHKYRDPKDGTRIDGKIFSAFFYDAMMGEMNERILETRNINPAQIGLPFILDKVSLSDDDLHPPAYTFREKEADTSAIVLLGQKASEVKSFSNQGQGSWQAKAPEKKQPIGKDAIIGRWKHTTWESTGYKGTGRKEGKGLFIECTRGYGQDLYLYKFISDKNAGVIRIKSAKPLGTHKMEYTGNWEHRFAEAFSKSKAEQQIWAETRKCKSGCAITITVERLNDNRLRMWQGDCGSLNGMMYDKDSR